MGRGVPWSGREGQTLNCSFCGKALREVKYLIQGPAVEICDECVGLCVDIIADQERSEFTGWETGEDDLT